MSYYMTFQDDRKKMRSEMLKAVDTFCDRLKFKEENQVNIGLKELEISINEAFFDTLLAHYENYNQTSKDDIEEMRRKMKAAVNTFWDGHKSEEDQVNIGLKELEHTVAKALPSPPCVNEEPPGPGAGLRGQSANKQESSPLLPEQQQELRNRVRPGKKPGPEPDPEPEGAEQPAESFCEWIMRLFREMLRRLQKMWQDVLAWVQEKWASLVNMVKSIWSEIKDFCSSAAKYFSSLFLV